MKHQQHIKILLLCTSMVFSGTAFAKVSGNCSSCHTMHNSQSSSVVNSEDLHESLLNDDCLGCHTGTNDGSNITPYVFDTDTVDYGASGIDLTGKTLAGGTFKYIASGEGDTSVTLNPEVNSDSYGHNVVGLGNTDETLLVPPGYAGGLAAADTTIPGNGSWTSGTQITCAGTYGCHGSHNSTSDSVAIRGGHHGDDSTIDGSTVAKSYRFLLGILGKEDTDWEFTVSSTDHNQYKGIHGGGVNSTISYLCAECHGEFHDGSHNSPWLRHPTDYSMGQTASGSEYRSYGGSGNPYLPATPLASGTVTTVVENITFGSSDIVTCLSCHRAHGSPYYKSMRWGYAESNDGGLCNNCHTSKN